MDAGSIPAMSTNQNYTSIRLCFFYPTGGNFCAFGTCEFHSRTRVPLCTRFQRDISTLPECLNSHFPPCPPCKQKEKSVGLFFFVYNDILLLQNDWWKNNIITNITSNIISQRLISLAEHQYHLINNSVLAIISSPFFLFLFIFQVADNFLLYNSIQIQKPIVPLFHRIFWINNFWKD